MKIKVYILVSVALLVLSTVFFLKQANPVRALCSGSGCDYQDPVNTGCSTAGVSTPAQKSGCGPSGCLLTELRYSSTCNANWARVTTQSGYRVMKAELTESGYTSELLSSTTLVYTDMLNGTYYHCAWGYMDTNMDPELDTMTDGACY